MKTITLAGEVYSRNVGDQAIHACLATILKEVDPNLEVLSLDLSGHAFRPPGNHPPVKDRLFSFLNLWSGSVRGKATRNLAYHRLLAQRKQVRLWVPLLEKADALVIGGGQLLMDNALDFPLKLSHLASLANALGIPVHISACGVGKAWSTAAQQLFQPILENATSITVRDGLSRERLGLFLPGFACQVTADPAILAGEVFPGKARVPQVERIGLGVMSREDVNSHLLGSDKFSELAWKDLWLDVVTCLVAEKMKVEIFTTGSQQDEHFAMQLFLAAHQRFCDSVSRANCPEGAMELLGTMRRYTLVIATRLHASILANALGISSLGLVWDGKVQSYYDEAALSERCFNLAGLQPANLVHACRSLNHQPFDGTLLAELKDNARENARVILKKDR